MQESERSKQTIDDIEKWEHNFFFQISQRWKDCRIVEEEASGSSGQWCRLFVFKELKEMQTAYRGINI